MKFKLISKLWSVLIIFFVIIFIIKNYETSKIVICSLSTYTIFCSIVFISIGKLFLVLNMQKSIIQSGIKIPFLSAFRIYNSTQLAKYTPGSIWQFVSKYHEYRLLGFSAEKIKDSILIETVAVAIGSTIFGLSTIVITKPAMFSKYFTYILGEVDPSLIIWLFILISISLIVFLLRVASSRWSVKRYLPRPNILAVQYMVWLCLGLGFFITIMPEILGSNSKVYSVAQSAIYIMGAYSFSYVAGLLVPFAPAGLGIREAFLVVGLAPFVSGEHALVLACFNRFLYILVEVVLGAFSFCRIFRKTETSAES